MFYEPKNGHGLPHNPAKAIVAPRPIGWISTIDAAGKPNLAPYSFFNMIADEPFLVLFSSDGVKDSVRNARETGEFVVNLASGDLAEKVVATSVDAPHGVDEFAYGGLTPAPSHIVKPPRVTEAGAALECKVTEIRSPSGLDGQPTRNVVVTGEVVGVHIDDRFLVDGLFDVTLAGNLSRLGYLDYSTIEKVFAMRRPKWGG
ncbi:MAG: flavin reductase family protein [Mesorhizobium sp.]